MLRGRRTAVVLAAQGPERLQGFAKCCCKPPESAGAAKVVASGAQEGCAGATTTTLPHAVARQSDPHTKRPPHTQHGTRRRTHPGIERGRRRLHGRRATALASRRTSRVPGTFKRHPAAGEHAHPPFPDASHTALPGQHFHWHTRSWPHQDTAGGRRRTGGSGLQGRRSPPRRRTPPHAQRRVRLRPAQRRHPTLTPGQRTRHPPRPSPPSHRWCRFWQRSAAASRRPTPALTTSHRGLIRSPRSLVCSSTA